MASNSENIELTQQERVAVVMLRHDIDLEDGDEVTAVFQRALTDIDTVATLLDLGELDFADSTLLNLILRAKAEHDQVRRPFVLAVTEGGAVRRLFDITGVTDVLALVGTRTEALRRIDTILDGDPDSPAQPTGPGS
ncbi:STAS domain-containing protein [Streptomyces kunmingensis]|uniref:STAS domain-containing protein n=1 Tax=Streptomyces kunmingensis TaxID=68225 RepID=A0ABU6CCI1_9ACTN|nr:STAS domain-containing protein [Streptomyces kunmingensis]MEB3961595.1 STAS domain-containing protein [Streptomyces kunmingensis]